MFLFIALDVCLLSWKCRTGNGYIAFTVADFFLDEPIVSFGNFSKITCRNFVAFNFFHVGLTFHKFLKLTKMAI
jgi:hypothetical protein